MMTGRAHDDRSVERESIQFPSLTLAGLARRVSTESPAQRKIQSRPATSTIPSGEPSSLPSGDGGGAAVRKNRRGGAKLSTGHGPRLHGLPVAMKRGWRALWFQSSANFRRCSMFVGGWPTSRRGLHGLDDPSWDRLPSGLIGKALGYGLVWTARAVWTLCQAAGKVQRSAGTAVNHQRRDEKQERRAGGPRPSCCQFLPRFFLRRRRKLHTLAVSSLTSPSRHGIAVAGWGPQYFPLLLNLFLDVIFPGSLRSRGCVGAKPTWSGWSTAHRPRPATDEPLGPPNHTPQAGSASIRQTNDSGVPVPRVCSFAPRVAVDEEAVAISRWSPRRIQIPGGPVARWTMLTRSEYCPLAALGCKRDLGLVPGGDGWRSGAEWRVQRETKGKPGLRTTGTQPFGRRSQCRPCPHITKELLAQCYTTAHQAPALLGRAPWGPGALGLPPRPPPFQSPPCANPRVVPWLPWHALIGADEVLMAQRG